MVTQSYKCLKGQWWTFMLWEFYFHNLKKKGCKPCSIESKPETIVHNSFFCPMSKRKQNSIWNSQLYFFKLEREGEEGKRTNEEGRERLGWRTLLSGWTNTIKHTNKSRPSILMTQNQELLATERGCCQQANLAMEPTIVTGTWNPARGKSPKPPLKFPVLRPGLFQMFKLQWWDAHSRLDICPVLPIYDASIFKKTGGPS